MGYYYRDRRVSSVMIEVNRRVYMNEATGEKLPDFEAAREFILGLVGVASNVFTA